MSDEQSKTEQPTPFRLQEARDRGQVARSAEASGVLVLLVFSIALTASSYGLALALAHSFTRTILLAGNAPAPSISLVYWLQKAFQPTWQALVPIVMAMLVAAVVGNVMQTGPVFSTTPLTPDFNRLNPAEGFKKLFSLRILWELCKLTVKLSVLGAVAWLLASSVGRKVQSA